MKVMVKAQVIEMKKEAKYGLLKEKNQSGNHWKMVKKLVSLKISLNIMSDIGTDDMGIIYAVCDVIVININVGSLPLGIFKPIRKIIGN